MSDAHLVGTPPTQRRLDRALGDAHVRHRLMDVRDRRILLWLFIALFLAAVIGPAVSFLVRRGWRRGLAVVAVVLTLTVLAGGAVFVFVRPLVTQSIEFAQDLPENLDRLQELRRSADPGTLQRRGSARAGLRRLPDRLLGFSGPLFSIFKTIGETIIALVSIAVMTVFLLLYGPQFAETALRLIPTDGSGDVSTAWA